MWSHCFGSHCFGLRIGFFEFESRTYYTPLWKTFACRLELLLHWEQFILLVCLFGQSNREKQLQHWQWPGIIYLRWRRQLSWQRHWPGGLRQVREIHPQYPRMVPRNEQHWRWRRRRYHLLYTQCTQNQQLLSNISAFKTQQVQQRHRPSNYRHSPLLHHQRRCRGYILRHQILTRKRWSTMPTSHIRYMKNMTWMT